MGSAAVTDDIEEQRHEKTTVAKSEAVVVDFKKFDPIKGQEGREPI
jgi:hypothetical protein|tara:strand:+ start:45 stop:182 length:138 start_codon:yes stop_codon:yes gene_type:complete